jgi:cytochrome c-type biogenesis protein CcmE
LKPKNQRLSLLILAIVCVLGAVLLAMSALRDQAASFYAPGDMKADRPEVGRAIRVGGMVKAGSLKHKKDGVTIEFRIHDETQETIKVRFRGIPPDLFKEESGVVAEGPVGRHEVEVIAAHLESLAVVREAEADDGPLDVA